MRKTIAQCGAHDDDAENEHLDSCYCTCVALDGYGEWRKPITASEHEEDCGCKPICPVRQANAKENANA